MRNNNFKKWLHHFIKEKYSPDEKEALLHWKQADPDEKNTLQLGLNADQAEKLKDRMRQGIQQRIDRDQAKKVKPITHLPAFIWRAAAVLVLICGTGWLYLKMNRELSSPSQVLENKSEHPLKYTLPDGSIVWLNSKTQLTINPGFNITDREVRLRGEAFFQVIKNPEKPFIVEAGQITTRVLGTSFNVKAYQEDKQYEVAVMEGKVAVTNNFPESQLDRIRQVFGNSKSGVVLLPHEKLTLDEQAPMAMQKEPAKITAVTAWKDNRFVFERVPLSEVFKQISRKYNVAFTAENPAVYNCTIRLDISGQSLEMMMKMICQLVDAKYKIDGKQIRIKGNGCK